jgi:putative spermidine/putrescine transport system substrate-binding protein/spermidine/putrescine transport system substrate-binding protein
MTAFTILRRTLTAAAAMAVAVGMLQPLAAGAKELRLLTWEGYAEDAWVKSFEEKYDATVSKTYVGSNDEYMAKLAAGGGDYDLVVIVSSLAQDAIDAGFVEPLDLSLIPTFKDLYPPLQALPFIQKDGKVYGAPTFVGITPITVNAEVIPDRTDFDLLFDPQYAGKITMWDDVSTIGDVAAAMGYDDIWNLTDEQLDAVKAKMIQQKPLIRKYWAQAGEVIELFASKEVVATNSWNYITSALLAQNFPAREFIPERPLGFIDSHFIVKGTANAELANQFIEHIIGAEAQARIAEVSGYLVTNPKSKEYMDPAVWARLHLDDNPQLLGTVKWWERIARRGKYLELLNEVKAAQ